MASIKITQLHDALIALDIDVVPSRVQIEGVGYNVVIVDGTYETTDDQAGYVEVDEATLNAGRHQLVVDPITLITYDSYVWMDGDDFVISIMEY